MLTGLMMCRYILFVARYVGEMCLDGFMCERLAPITHVHVPPYIYAISSRAVLCLKLRPPSAERRLDSRAIN
jgi:hypothetical protein